MSEKYSGQCYHGVPLGNRCMECVVANSIIGPTIRAGLNGLTYTPGPFPDELTQLRSDLAKAEGEREELERGMTGRFNLLNHARLELNQAIKERDTLKAECERMRSEAEDYQMYNERLLAENHNLIAATKGRTMFYDNEAANREMGLLRAQLTTSREEGYRQGLETAARMAESRANKITPWASAGHDLRRGELFELAEEIRSESSTLPRTYEQGAEDMRERAYNAILGAGYEAEPTGISALRVKWAKAIRALPTKEG